jgi:DinB superfamily
MTTIQEVNTALHATFAPYLAALDGYTEEQFMYKENEETWSLGQMYEHICGASTHFFLANTVRCLEKRNGQEGGERNEYGDNVMKYNGFPPIKVKVPNPTGAVQPSIVPQAKESYRQRIALILKSADELAEKVTADAGTYRNAHPVFGWLNASEWFRNLEMHTRHHLRQKAELEAFARIV